MRDSLVTHGAAGFLFVRDRIVHDPSGDDFLGYVRMWSNDIRLTECYLALGLNDEAKRTASVLGYNYPGSEWYRDSYALVTNSRDLPPDLRAQKGWFGRVVGSVF